MKNLARVLAVTFGAVYDARNLSQTRVRRSGLILILPFVRFENRKETLKIS
jgi:hypothetical protein